MTLSKFKILDEIEVYIGENQLFLRFIEFLKNLSEFEPEQKTFRIVSIKFGEQSNIESSGLEKK